MKIKLPLDDDGTKICNDTNYVLIDISEVKSCYTRNVLETHTCL